MGRVIVDGALFFYVQDVVVDPDHQKTGIGQMLMDRIEMYLKQKALKGATIGLFAAQGKEGFYTQYGYAPRTGQPLGFAMCKFV